ncbi:MAG TPA: bacteriohopanetetrol glucosamine biosynthesis glycosyltransferase HpnI [Candidatus Baltobacteraceae bacterium]|nr:bacteriohopanetetrol glucosamine biosynthesis glycosyltransferase HpnI [Candidatus Baltobacteraceae bacterium]
MSVNVRAIAAGILTATSLFGMAYTAFAMVRLRAFEKRERDARMAGSPSITILKPLHGDEPQLYEHLRSFCDQRYEQFDIVFGAADANDPALPVARRLQHEFPDVPIRIVAGSPGKARNPKVANLLGMEPFVTGDLIVIADSDIRVHENYLALLAAPFEDDAVGAATCIFSGLPNETPASRIGAMAITDEFSPSVLVAATLAPVDFCVGATVAVRAPVFREFGGFASIADCLADDYEIGQQVVRSGHKIVLAPFAVQTAVPERRLRDIWHHEVRWARTVFRARPAGYAGTIVMHYPVLLLAAAVLNGFSMLSIALFAAGAALRTFNHTEAHRILAPRQRASSHLLPVRIVLSLGVWCAAFSGRRVGWRGTEYAVDAEGRLVGNPGDL